MRRRGAAAARLVVRIAVALALLAAIVVPGRDVDAQSCTPEKDRPTVLVVWRILGRYSPDTADLLATNLTAKLAQRVPEVRWVRLSELQLVAGFQIDRETLGGAPAEVSEILGLIGTPFVLDLLCSEVSGGRGVMTATFAATDTRTTLRRVQRRYPIRDPGQALDQIESMSFELAPPSLLCELLERRDRPAVPALTLQVTPQEVLPSATIRVRARLTDASSGAAQPGKQVRLLHEHGLTELSSRTYTTDQDGVVLQDLTASSQPGRPSVEATYTGLRGRVKRSSPRTVRYRVRNPSGDLTIRAPQASLNVGGADTVTAALQRAGAPVSGAAITFAATDGTIGSPSVTTAADGSAVTTFQAPANNTVVDVVATTPAPPSKGPRAGGSDLSATLTYVVDAGVTLALTTVNTAGGTAAPVAADLLAGGSPIAATDVTFSLTGAGALSAASAPTNAAGRAEVLWLPPAGSSAATITAEAVVDGRRYVQTAAVSASPATGGTLTAKVLPGNLALEIVTGAIATAPEPAEARCISTLVQTSNCGPVDSVDYGTQPADAPVSIRADGAGHWVSVSVTNPSANVAVVEVAGSNPADGHAISASAFLELTASGPGTIEIAVEDPQPGPSGTYIVRRPGTGARFTDTSGVSIALRDPASTASADLGQSGPQEFQLFAFSSGTLHGSFSGTRRFTFTFRPR